MKIRPGKFAASMIGLGQTGNGFAGQPHIDELPMPFGIMHDKIGFYIHNIFTVIRNTVTQKKDTVDFFGERPYTRSAGFWKNKQTSEDE